MTTPADPERRSEAASGGQRSLNRARLLERIAGSAHELFQAAGYEAVTMERIAACAGVSKRTLYKYFPAKEAILAYQLESELAKDVARLDARLDEQAGFRANLSALLAESAAWCERHADHLLPYIRYKFATFEPAHDPSDERGLVQAWTTLIASGQQRKELDATRPAAQLATYFHYLYLGALMRWITDRRLNLPQEFQAAIDLFIDGAAARLSFGQRTPRS